MRQCQSCGSLLSVHSPVCVACGTADAEHQNEAATVATELPGEIASRTGGQMVAIARFASPAEAGYFADDLEQSAQIEAKLTIQEQYDALTGRWRHDYVLLVEEPHAARAAAHLHEQVNETPDDDYKTDGPAPLAEDATAIGLNWVPILLTTLAAGSMAYWGAKKIEERPRPPALGDHQPHRRDDLWKAVANTDGPWFQQIGDGPGVRMMRADARGRILIQEDRDGDQKVDREYWLRR